MSRIRLAVWLLGGLTAVALLFSTQVYVFYRAEGLRVSFLSVFVLQLGHWYCWMLAGPVAWALASRWPLRAQRRLQNGVRHLAVALGVAAVIVFACAAVDYGATRFPLTRHWFTDLDRSRALTSWAMFFFSIYFHVELLVYGGIVAVAHAVRSNHELRAREREALQLSSQLTAARLQVLTAQLQPHFLFNTLHTIGSLILQRKSDEAMRILAELGELLRMTLARQESGLIPLAGEIEHLERYLRIEEARFGDRLRVVWEIDPAALDAPVPPLILQPLVENALRHGISKRTEPSTLAMRAAVTDSRVRVSVYNDGPLLPAGWSTESSLGFGLRNVRDRLDTRGGGSTLTVENVGTTGVRAAIELPAVSTAEGRSN